MPSLSTTSSSVFARFGKRPPPSPNATPDEQQHSVGPPPPDPPPSPPLTAQHKRDSSLLSLSSVHDLGHNVRRSVSLRSHRTQPSGGSLSTGLGHKPRFPSSGNLITSPLTTSPAEEEEPSALPPISPQPKSRGKLSLSARSFSSKFKSTDHLPPLSPPEQLDGALDRPPTAVDTSKHHHLVPMPATPAVPKRAPPDRPSLPPQPSFARDLSSSHGANGAPLHTASSAPAATSGGYNPHAVYQQIHETAARRMATLEYMRKAHEGNLFYFGTLHYTPTSLQTLPSLHPLKLGRRATNSFVLGYSLPTLLDMNSSTPLEYLKALSALLQEFETYQSLSGLESSSGGLSRGRMGQMLKSGMGLGTRSAKGRRASTATDIIAMTPQSSDLLGLPRSTSSGSDATSPLLDSLSPINAGSGHDFQHLATPHLPFDPDFNTTFASLCDTLIDTYGKLLELVPAPEVCGPGVGEAFAKADKAVRKILIATHVREFEDSTRAGVKGEVAGLGRLVLGGLV